MRELNRFHEIQDQIHQITGSVTERINSSAAQRRLKQMQAKKEKDARKQKAKAGA